MTRSASDVLTQKTYKHAVGEFPINVPNILTLVDFQIFESAYSMIILEWKGPLIACVLIKTGGF